MNSSFIGSMHEISVPSHPTQSRASKIPSSSIIAKAGSHVEMDAKSIYRGPIPRNHPRTTPKSKHHAFLFDSESESDQDLSAIHVKTRRERSPVSPVRENDINGE